MASVVAAAVPTSDGSWERERSRAGRSVEACGGSVNVLRAEYWWRRRRRRACNGVERVVEWFVSG
jgi:hypothetical protein